MEIRPLLEKIQYPDSALFSLKDFVLVQGAGFVIKKVICSMFHLTSLICIALVISAQSAKVLLIPGPAVSHCLEIMAIGKELLDRGHHVTLFVHLFEPKHCLKRWTVDNPKFKVVSPKVDPNVEEKFKSSFSAMDKVLTGGGSLLWFAITMIKPTVKTFCSSAFSDQLLLHNLQNDEYNLAVVEGLPFTSCLFAIPVYLGIPYAAIGSLIDPLDTQMPLQSNTFPNMFSEYTNEMTFKERFLNTLVYFVNPVIKCFINPSLDLSEYSSNLKGVDTSNLIKDSVLFLENSDYFFDYPKAVFPNFIQVGALTADPGNLLPSDLKKYIEESKEGVILVSFGSVLNNTPDNVIENVLKALRRFKQNVIFKHHQDEISGNIKKMKWVPQNDVLGHPNVKLFISHCGKNGFWEGVYHGVPIICTPFGTDQIATGIKVRKHGIGASVNIFRASSDEIYETINYVLENSEIKRNMKKMSDILRDRPETASQRAASALEHVIKYGGDHMRPVDVRFFSLIYADIWLTLIVISLVLYALLLMLCRRCCRAKDGAKQKPD